MNETGTADSGEFEARVIRTVTWRLLPFLVLLYFVAFLDRINVGFAALTMNKDLAFTSQVFGFGAGIFFLGYFAFEVPSTIILHQRGCALLDGRVLITWGLVSVGMAFIRGPISFYVLRFLLGLAEAGFFPGNHPLPQLLVPSRSPVGRHRHVHGCRAYRRCHRLPDLWCSHAA